MAIFTAVRLWKINRFWNQTYGESWAYILHLSADLVWYNTQDPFRKFARANHAQTKFGLQDLMIANLDFLAGHPVLTEAKLWLK